MIAVVAGLLGALRESTAVRWLLAVAAGAAALLGFAKYEQRQGAGRVHTQELERAASDARTASGNRESIASETDGQVLDELLKDARP